MAFKVQNTNLREKLNETIPSRAARDVERITQGSESIEDDLSKIHCPVILNQSVYRPPSVKKDSKFKLPVLA